MHRLADGADDQPAGQVGAPQAAGTQGSDLLGQLGSATGLALGQAHGGQQGAHQGQADHCPGAGTPAVVMLDPGGHRHAGHRREHQPGEHHRHRTAAFLMRHHRGAQGHAQADAGRAGHAHDDARQGQYRVAGGRRSQRAGQHVHRQQADQRRLAADATRQQQHGYRRGAQGHAQGVEGDQVTDLTPAHRERVGQGRHHAGDHEFGSDQREDRRTQQVDGERQFGTSGHGRP